MGFCPVCKKEYGLTVTICPECNALLKEDADAAKIPMFSLQKEEDAKGFIDYAAAKDVKCAYEYSSRENAFRIFVTQKDQKKCPKLFAEYCMKESRKKKGIEEPAPASEKVEEPVPEATPAETVSEQPSEAAPVVEEPATPARPPRSREEIRESLNQLFNASKSVAEQEAKTNAAFTSSAPLGSDAFSVKEEPKSAAPEKPVIPEAPKASASTSKKASDKKAPEPVIVVEKPKPEVKQPASKQNGPKSMANFRMGPTGQFGSPNPKEDSKHQDILNLFMNPAQPAPKRDNYASLEHPAKDDSKSKFKLAPGEDPLFDMPSDPFYGNRPKANYKDFNKSKAPKVEDILVDDTPIIEDFSENDVALEESFTPAEDTVADSASAVSDFTLPPEVSTETDSAEEPAVDISNLFEDNASTDSFKQDDAFTFETESSDENPEFIYSSEPDFEPDETDSYSYVPEEENVADNILTEAPSVDEDLTEETGSTVSDPIFVEVEPIKDEELDDINIIDAVDVITLENEEPENSEEEEEDDAYSAFLNQFKAGINPSDSVSEEPLSGTSASDVDEMLDSFISEIHDMETSEATGDSVITEVVPDKDKYENADDYTISSTSGRPKDIQDTKIKVSADSNIIEEVFDTNVEIGKDNSAKGAASSVANDTTSKSALSSKPAPKADKDFSDLDGYKGFVPDYSFEEKKDEEVEETAEQKAYREFTEKVEERKRANELAASQAKKEVTRKANLEGNFGKKGKIVFEDTEELDNYAGFVPDYKPNTSNEDEFDFYKPHTVSSYAKYKKGKKDSPDGNLTNITHMRTTSNDEIRNMFIDKVPSGVKNVIDASLIRTTGFLISMSGKQLSQLFNSWLMLNMTTGYVKQFESSEATIEENAENKINGIKKVLKGTFGDLNESFLDYVVRKYYSKYLDE